MLEYDRNKSKGEVVENGYILGLTKEAYDIIYTNFPDRKQADTIASVFEKVLLQLDSTNRQLIDDRLEMIILKIKEKMAEEFATKSDLEAGLAKLELKLMREIEKTKSELSDKIDEVDKRLTRVEEKIDFLDKKIDIKIDFLDKKIDSNLKWIGAIVGGGIAFIGVLSNLKSIIAFFP